MLRCSLVTRIQRNGIAIEVSEDAAKSKDHAYCRRCEALIGQKQWMHKDKPVAPSIRRRGISDAKGRQRPLDLRILRSELSKAKQ